MEDDAWALVARCYPYSAEMRGLATEEIPASARAAGGEATILRSLTLRTTGIAESSLPALLGEFAAEIDGMRVAYQPHPSGVDVRLTVQGVAPNAANQRLQRAADELRRRIGLPVYGVDDQDLADVVVRACRERGWRIAVAESCTGGLLGGRLTNAAGASDVFVGGVIAYDNAVKESLLGVPSAELAAHGAVSESVASEMAKGARRITGAHVGWRSLVLRGRRRHSRKARRPRLARVDTPVRYKDVWRTVIGERTEIAIARPRPCSISCAVC